MSSPASDPPIEILERIIAFAQEQTDLSFSDPHTDVFDIIVASRPSAVVASASLVSHHWRLASLQSLGRVVDILRGDELEYALAVGGIPARRIESE